MLMLLQQLIPRLLCRNFDVCFSPQFDDTEYVSQQMENPSSSSHSYSLGQLQARLKGHGQAFGRRKSQVWEVSTPGTIDCNH